ncbi:hypothetical protein PVAND_014502 [Polypedilum vanderplanki]|uniref:Uncharacterized protein n=1 Tax=Polypedilum vanderplanki TaxID=319348 RepID=A0A9J6BAD6_POLVA|nr:hypothetical protein PVAND_014502 [Polypedilum vanderplanki]
MKVAILLLILTIITTAFACKPTQEAFLACNNTPGKHFDTLKCVCACDYNPVRGHACNSRRKYDWNTGCCVCKHCHEPNKVPNRDTCLCE